MGAWRSSVGEKDYALTQRLLSYLLKHPDAEDTVDGIARWWLLREQIDQGLEEVERTLRLLVKSGLLVERQGTLGRSYYAINDEMTTEIREMVGGKLDKGDSTTS